MGYRVESAFGTTTSDTWATLIAAPNENEIIAVKSLTFDNLDDIAHLYSFALLISGVRYAQITSASKATLTYDFITMAGVILLTTTGTSFQFRTDEAVSTVESKITAHYARRS